MFDFKKPKGRTFIETVSAIAHLAQFVIADLTDPKIVLQEIPHISENIAIPLQPIMLEGSGREPITLLDLRKKLHTVLKTSYYKNTDDLINNFDKKVINPIKTKLKELENI